MAPTGTPGLPAPYPPGSSRSRVSSLCRVLILLPPSEGKTPARRGKPLDLQRLSFPELTAAREEAIEALTTLCEDQDVAVEVLGLGATQADQVTVDATVRTAPTTRADRLYTGVLYDALDLGSLPTDAKRRASRWLVVASGLFGLVRPGDAIPAYRLSGGVSLPALGPVAGHWRAHLDPAVRSAAGSGLVLDLRSSTYAGFWRPEPDVADRVATVRVLHEKNGKRSVVSHFNKATKGRLVRDLLLDGTAPATPPALADHLTGLGWHVEPGAPSKTGHPLDVVVREL